VGGDPKTPQHDAPDRLARVARTDRQLLKGASVTVFSRGFSKFAQILFLVVAARLLPVDEFAAYSYMLALAFVFGTLSDAGVHTVAGRDASAGRAAVGELFYSALPVVVVGAVLAGLLLLLFGAVDSGPGSSFLPVLIVAAFVLFNRLLDLIGQLLRGVGRFTFEATLQGVGAIAFIAGSIIVMAAGYGVTAVLAVLCAKELASGVVGYIALRADIEHPEGVRPRSDWRRLLSIGIRLSIAGIALAVAMRIPLALLGNVGTTTEVALFSAAQRFADAAYVLAWTGGFALLPGIAYLAGADFPRARRLVHQVLFALIAASAVLAGLALPLAEPLMRITFGSDFAEGADLLRIVLAGIPASTALGICWYAVVAFDGEARLLGIGLIGLAVCVVLSLALIPSATDTGAAWTYVGFLYAMAALAFALLERQLGRTRPRPPEAEAPRLPMEVSG
jgi:O-antigen/teichoic acid export membrane protein